MDAMLRVLLLDDVPADSRLVARELERSDFAVSMTQVATAGEFASRLLDRPNLVIANYSLPSFGALDALAVLRERRLDVPLIVVTSSANDEEVVECMRAGASDYIPRDRLARLGPAVSAALASREDRAKQQRAESAIRRRDAILESVSHAVYGLLSAPDWKSALVPELSRLGSAADVECVSVLRLASGENCDRDEGTWTSARSPARGPAGFDCEVRATFAETISTEWRDWLESGVALARRVSDLPEPERRHFAGQGIESVLIAPVVAGDNLWGALAFGEASAQRDWEPSEIGALETAARIIGAVVQREQVALALRLSEEENRAILRAIPDLMLRVGADGIVLGNGSEAGVELPDRSDGFAGRPLDSIFPDAPRHLGAAIGDVLESGTPAVVDRVRMEDARGRHFELRIVRAGSGEALAIARDITEGYESTQRTRALKAAVQVLEQSQTVPEMVSRMLEVLGGELGWDIAAYWTVDMDVNALRFVEMWHREQAATGKFEAAARRLSILQGSGVIGRVWESREPAWIEDVSTSESFLMTLDAERAGLKTALAFAVMSGGAVYGVVKLIGRIRRRRDENLVRASESLGMQIGQFMERKHRERQVSESEARFQVMADMAPVLMWVADVTGECIFANKPWLEFTGLGFEASLRDGWIRVVHPDDLARLLGVYESAFADRVAFQCEHRMRRYDGEYRWVLNTGAPRFDADGEFVGYIGSSVDITEQIRVEDELRRERQFIQTLLDTIDVGIVACNASGELTLINRATRQLLGLTESLVTKDDWAVAAKLYREDATTPLRRDDYPLIRALHGESVRNVEVTSLSDPAVPKTLLVSGQRIVGPEGEVNGAVVAFRDVTSERLLEGQFRQAHKMEAVGRLAGGVAHDFNNILTVITGYGEMLRLRLEGSEQLLQFADEVLGASSRAASLTRQLLAFSRKQLLQPRPVELNALIRNLTKMLERLIGEDVELRIKLDPDVASIFADPGQIEQVVINLAVNARDAMPDGGTLVIETGSAELDQMAVECYGDIRPGRFHVVSVSDTGCGMSPETMSHIFEPFFTTKGADRGTGLGLATVYGIVRQSNGAIFATSEPGVGTVFKICLPVHLGNRRLPDDHAHAAMPTSRGERILVVEDDRAVRTLVCSALLADGYRIVEAQNGEEALELFASEDFAVDLILSDMVMPKMSGRELSRRVAAVRPSLRVLFMSGYTHDILSGEELSLPGMFVLEKPFSRNDLARAVRRAIDGVTAVEARTNAADTLGSSPLAAAAPVTPVTEEVDGEGSRCR